MEWVELLEGELYNVDPDRLKVDQLTPLAKQQQKYLAKQLETIPLS